MHTLLDLLFKDPVIYFMIVLVVIGSIVLHELGHALTATWEGDPTPRMRGHLTWNPVVHMGWFSILLVAVMGLGWGATTVNRSTFRHRRWGQVLVSGAGPAVNVLLALLASFVLVIAARNQAELGERTLLFWSMLLRLNIALSLLNLLPAPPLDGFSVLDGIFDLGDFGVRLKQAGMIPLLVAILIVNSEFFDKVIDTVIRAFLLAARACVGA